MKYITLLAGASTALAAALSIAAPEGKTVLGLPEGYAWSVQNWHAGCARSGCSYNFNVTGPQSDYIPAFTAYCYGEDKAFFKLCDILEGNGTEVKNIPFVAASLKPSTGDGAPMSVSLQFVDAATGVTHNITGSHTASFNAFVAPLENFNVEPEQVTKLAAPVTQPPPARQS